MAMVIAAHLAVPLNPWNGRALSGASSKQFVGVSPSRGLHCQRSFVAVGKRRAWLRDSALIRIGRKSGYSCVGANAVDPVRKLQQTAEDVREQLEALQQEAEQVRGKANSARLRFMRLTHVVEQLRQRAAMDVRLGNEDSARGLLLEKQKVMKALEAARRRAELLEQLAGKLNVAISMKETLLIAALSTAPVSSRSEAGDDAVVHHVSPRTGSSNKEIVQSGVDGDGDDISSRAGLKHSD